MKLFYEQIINETKKATHNYTQYYIEKTIYILHFDDEIKQNVNSYKKYWRL